MAATATGSHHARVTRSFVLALFLAVALGCAPHYVNRGTELYAGGRYIEAAEIFERTEPRLATSSPPERCRYALYRGATLLALGDEPRGESWLRYCNQILQTEPEALSQAEHTMLGRALRDAASQRTAPPAIPARDGATVATHRPGAPETNRN